MNKGSPYDAKIHVAEIGAVNMGEIGAVRKRSCSETGPHDSSPCVARVIYIYIYRVYVDSHSLGQLALASKRTASNT